MNDQMITLLLARSERGDLKREDLERVFESHHAAGFRMGFRAAMILVFVVLAIGLLAGLIVLLLSGWF